MATRVYMNNVSTRLTAAIAAGDLTINVTAGTGANFASATGGDWIIATLVKVSGYREIAWEIVKITARATDALTIVRAQESTTAIAFAVGDVVDVRATKDSFTNLAGNVTIPGTLGVTGAINGSGVITSTVADGIGAITIAPSTGTSGAAFLATSTGGNLYFGMDNSTNTVFGKGAYGTNINRPAATVFALTRAGAVDISVDGTGAVTIPGTLGVTGAITGSAPIKAGGYTVATLPANVVGQIAYVTDQLTAAAAKGVAPAGGGAVVCYVMNTGAGWVGI